MNNSTIWLASFDIGKKNFAFYIEEIDTDKMSTIENIPKHKRYLDTGECTPEFENIINDVNINGKIILIDNIDLTYGTDKSKYLDPTIFVNMNKALDKYKKYWDKCSSFVIEQQMGFGNKRNYMALKLGQHCFSYFIFNYANFKQTVEFPSYHKTKVLGACKNMTKYNRKTWAVKKALQILKLREDNDNMIYIEDKKKKDDVSDVICQLQAYKYLVFVDKTL